MQEFNIEKLQLLDTEKAKIKKEYERREGQIEVKKKMCVLACTYIYKHILQLQLQAATAAMRPVCALTHSISAIHAMDSTSRAERPAAF